MDKAKKWFPCELHCHTVHSDGDFTVEGTVEDSSASLEHTVERIALSEAMSKLDEQSRRIIILRYFRDMSQQQVADILGLSQVKISREEKKIIAALRRDIV